ncbi:transposase [Streptomyces tubercidicus]
MREAPLAPDRRSPPEQLTGQIRELEDHLARHVKCHFPQLLASVGIGPDSAVTSLITIGANPERLGSEASFPALCGVSPIERSSGRHHHRRLNRGATGRPMSPCTGSCRPVCPTTRAPGLLRAPHPGGQDPTRDRPMPQTLRCPRGASPGQAHTVMIPAIGAAET